MKKKIFKTSIASILLFFGLLFLKPSEVQAQVPVEIGTRGCVCKEGACVDQNVVSFRKHCGHRQGGPASGDEADLLCSMGVGASTCQ